MILFAQSGWKGTLDLRLDLDITFTTSGREALAG